jgi:hypothetical protein
MIDQIKPLRFSLRPLRLRVEIKYQHTTAENAEYRREIQLYSCVDKYKNN